MDWEGWPSRVPARSLALVALYFFVGDYLESQVFSVQIKSLSHMKEIRGQEITAVSTGPIKKWGKI